MASVVSVSIDSIAAGGDGVGRQNGLVVFVPRTAPGDVVTARIAGKGRFARGALSSLVTLSPARVEPPCEHYKRDNCGGCQIQHLRYDAQLSAKRRIVSDAIQRIAKREPSGLADAEPSPKEWRYRTKLTLAMRKQGSGWIAGLHRYDDPSRIFALADCPITERSVLAVWKEIIAAQALLPDAAQLRGSVRVGDTGATFLLYGGLRWADAERFFGAVPSLGALWWEPEIGERRLVKDRRTVR